MIDSDAQLTAIDGTSNDDICALALKSNEGYCLADNLSVRLKQHLT